MAGLGSGNVVKKKKKTGEAKEKKGKKKDESDCVPPSGAFYLDENYRLNSCQKCRTMFIFPAVFVPSEVIGKCNPFLNTAETN